MKKLSIIGISLFLLVLTSQSAFAAAREWKLDPAHSNIYFSTHHIFATIRGRFHEFTGKVNFDPKNLKESRFVFQIKVDSVDTGVSKRDRDLVSANFFDADKYPLITFESDSVTDAGGGVYNLAGKLKIKGKVHDLTLPLTLAGIKDHPVAQGKQVIGFNGKITVDRLAYGVGNGRLYKLGMAGKDVEVLVSFEALSDK
jgi:polyisoprenoid-binding protein YceI